MSKRKTIATHHGSFHADDVFGVAVLMGVFPDHTLVRTRDQAVIDAADFAVDVGGVWDAATGRFDHHQRSFHGARAVQPGDAHESPVGYASAGLVWSVYGPDYVRALALRSAWALDEPALQAVAAALDQSLVQYIDMVDTGQAEVAPGIFGLSSLLGQLNSNWMEEQGLDAAAKAQLQDARFRQAVAVTRQFLDRAIVKRVGQHLSANTVRQSRRLLEGRVLLLEQGGMPWSRVVVEEMPEVLFVIYPDSDGTQYQIKAVPVAPDSFQSRLDLPQAWGGLRDAELAAVTGVADSVFCHSNLFIGGARSLDGALQMAALALGPSA